MLQIFLSTNAGLCADYSTLSPALNINHSLIKSAYLLEQEKLLTEQSCFSGPEVSDLNQDIARLVDTAFSGFVEDLGEEKPDIDIIFKTFMKLCIKKTKAPYGSILLKNREEPFLNFAYFTGPASGKLKYLGIPSDVGISGMVLAQKKSIIANEQKMINKMSRAVDKFTDLKTHNLLCFPIEIGGKVIGVLELVNKADGFTEDDITLVKEIFNKQEKKMEDALKFKDQKTAFLAACIKLANQIEAKDLYTGGHVLRVKRYVLMIAEELGLSEKQKFEYQVAAILHDVGKISIPAHILNKPGPLTDEEFKTIKTHTSLAMKYLKTLYVGDVLFTDILSRFVDLDKIEKGIVLHHERLDGRGYYGLTCDKIPAIAKVLAVADIFDAITSDRPYHENRKGYSFEQAIEKLQASKELQVCPEVVDAFVKALRRKINLNDILTQESLMEMALSDNPVIAEKALSNFRKLKGVKAKRFERDYLFGKEGNQVHGFWELGVLLGQENTDLILDGIIRSTLKYGEGSAAVIVRIVQKDRVRFIIQDNGYGSDLADVEPKIGIKSLANGEIVLGKTRLWELISLVVAKFKGKVKMSAHGKYRVFYQAKSEKGWRSRIVEDPELNKGLRLEVSIPIADNFFRPRKVELKKTSFELLGQAI